MRVRGSENPDNVFGFEGDDTIFGLGGNDVIIGGLGADIADGGAGNDFASGGFGADTLDRGTGIDYASYFDSTEGVNVDLSTGQGFGGTTQGATAIGVILGTANDDFLVGNGSPNGFEALDGNDTIKAGGGADMIDGGGDIDTASYLDSSAGVSVSLVTGRGSGGTAQGDQLTSIENLTGSAHNDTLEGNSSDNTLVGFDGIDTLRGGGGADTLSGDAGNDTLDGGSQHDVLWGGAGADVLTGGAGSDYFYFHTADSGRFAAGQADAITDFTDGDRIYLQGSYTFAGGGDTTPDAGEYAVFWNADANGWMVSWNNGGTVHDVVVYGGNPLGDIWFFS